MVDASPPTVRLMRKRRRARQPVTARSLALFRLGEVCNNNCPMCSNSGRPEAWHTDPDELLKRIDFLDQQGMRRVIVTGGEPTIHRGFWSVVERLVAKGIAWDINTHGRSFADPDFAERALALGLERVIVSLHSHKADVSSEISGFQARQHKDTIAGIDQLVAGGADVMINCVFCQPNLGHLEAYLDFCVDRWGSEIRLKFAFPTTIGRGGEWAGIQLRYDQLRAPVAALRAAGQRRDVQVIFESVPNCVLGDANARDLSRSGFGESHYLDDLNGDQLYPIRYIEAELSTWADFCRDCAALERCPGVAEDYARRHGVGELRAMVDDTP